MYLEICVVKRRFAERPQRLRAGDRRREFSAEQFVDDESGIVVLDVEVAENSNHRGDVDRQVAVGEDDIDLPPVL